MTTAIARRKPSVGAGILLAAGGFCLAAGAVTAVVGALVQGSDAALGAVVATAIVLLVFGGGAALVNLVAGALPSASMLIALLTYTLQVVLMFVIMLAISRSGVLDDAVDKAWLAGTLIGGTAAWLVSQVVAATKVRIPVFDTEEAGER